MAETTLKDVLDAIAGFRAESEKRFIALEKGQAALKKDVGALKKDVGALERGQAALVKKVAKVEAKVDAHRKETKAGFKALDKELSGHADPVHRDLEADIIAIHRPLAKAHFPGVPKDLPSEVRAKGERPKRRARAR